jgi:magnesium-transporting ATPase (P-type)
MLIRDGDWRELRSDEIVVGDLVLIDEDDMFAADLILLSASNEGDTCFI